MPRGVRRTRARLHCGDLGPAGTGKSYPAIEPTATHTLDAAVADTIELTRYLPRRFDEQKISLLGNS
jgi:hypothetical protein